MTQQTSKGHVATSGKAEFFHGPDGTLWRSSIDGPLAPDGYRRGARFECAPRPDGHAHYLASAHDIEVPSPLARRPETTTNNSNSRTSTPAQLSVLPAVQGGARSIGSRTRIRVEQNGAVALVPVSGVRTLSHARAAQVVDTLLGWHASGLIDRCGGFLNVEVHGTRTGWYLHGMDGEERWAS